MPLKWVNSIPAAAARSTNHSSSRASGRTVDAWLPQLEDCGGSAAGAPGPDMQEIAPPHRTNRSRGAVDERSCSLTRITPSHDTAPARFGPGLFSRGSTGGQKVCPRLFLIVREGDPSAVRRPADHALPHAGFH